MDTGTRVGGGRRLGCAALAMFVVAGGLLATSAGAATAPAPAVPGTITTWAGGTGEGPALNVSVRPGELASRGPFVYITDDGHDAARVLDTRTGDLRTVAGNGDPENWAHQTPRNDGGLATSERISQPAGVAADAAGNVYVSDYWDNRVRRVDSGGVITTFAGGGPYSANGGDGGPATKATVGYPNAIALDGTGNAYVLEDTFRVRRISTTGIITRVAGNFCACYAGPVENVRATDANLAIRAIAVDPSGHLYLTHYDWVLRVDDAGVLRRIAGGGSPSDGFGDGGPATEASIALPSALAFDSAGNLFITDERGRVRKVDTGGVISTVAGGGNPADGLGDGGPATAASIDHPEGVTVGPGGDLFISDTYHMRVRKVSDGMITTVAGNGTGRSGGDGGPASKAQFSDPQGLARDAAGNLFVADKYNHRIRRIDGATGMVTTVAGNGARGHGGDGGPATAAQLFEPLGVAVDGAGNVFVTESAGNRVRKVNTLGLITTFAGGGPAVPGDGGPATGVALGAPSGLAVDGAGNLYIADVGHDLVRKVTPDGIISTIAGGGHPPTERGDVGDHGPATSAKLWLSSSSMLAFDALGQLHLTAGLRVRKIDLGGVITTVAGNGSYYGPDGDGAPATDIRLREPTGLAFDANGNLYVADSDMGKIRMVDTMGRVRTVAGTGNIYTGLGDGGPAVDARIDLGNSGMAFDEAGNLYVTDTFTHRIRRIERPFTPTRVLAAGWNGAGQVGDGTTVERHNFVVAGGVANVTAVGAGYYHSLAVRADGTVWAWGWNYFGQLGDGTTVDRHTPVQVAGLDHVVAVAGGAYHSLAVRADGTVWAWGWNGVGQLADGTRTDRHAPVQIPGLSNIREVAAGAFHNLAVTHDGAVWAWGWNKYGQLGTGSLSALEVRPVSVPSASGSISVATGAVHSLAIRHLGDYYEVWGWGWNGFGQVGDGTTVERRLPVKTRADGRWVRAGAYQSFAGSGGFVWAWGYNAFGQLGVRSSAPAIATPTWQEPLAVDGLAPGAFHTAMVTGKGSIIALGWNAHGMLGDGTVVNRRVPSVVPGVTGADTAAAGAVHTVVIQ